MRKTFALGCITIVAFIGFDYGNVNGQERMITNKFYMVRTLLG